MEQLDRYLNAVSKQLPWQRRDDILAELRANLESQLDEKETALGRPLTAPEAEEWVRQLGSPMQMAAHYQPQQYLIGPAMFPIYRHVLKLACSWGTIIYSVATVSIIMASRTPNSAALFGALLRLPGVLITIAAWVTAVFAALEYGVTHGHIAPDKLGPLAKVWSPSILSPLDVPGVGGKKPKSFAQAVVGTIFGVFFLGWLLLLPQHPWLLFGPGVAYLHASPYQLAPVWIQFFWCLVALNIFQVGWEIENLANGRWQRPQPIKNIVSKAFGIVAGLFVVMAPGQVLVLLKNPATDQASHGAQLDAINMYLHRSFLIVVVIASLQLAWEGVRLSINAYRRHAAAAV